jgi:hypothetical protein
VVFAAMRSEMRDDSMKEINSNETLRAFRAAGERRGDSHPRR